MLLDWLLLTVCAMLLLTLITYLCSAHCICTHRMHGYLYHKISLYRTYEQLVDFPCIDSLINCKYLYCCWLESQMDSSVVFRVKSKGRVSGFCGRVMLGSSRVRGLHLHGSQLDIMYVVMSCLDNWLIIFVVRYS